MQQASTAPSRTRRVDIPRLKKGLDIPITGAPEQRIEDVQPVVSCALTGMDYLGLKPKMEVAEGDRVKLGQPLFRDKRFPSVAFTAPAAGVVRSINRGARRVLQSVVVDIDDSAGAVRFFACEAAAIDRLGREAVVRNLLESGLWPCLRTRPYSKIPDPDTQPQAIFIQAIESAPLAADPAVVIGEAPEDFINGVRLVSKLTAGETYVCQRTGAALPQVSAERVVTAGFDGPHPAGLPGTHIHFLHPAAADRVVWTLHYQDVMAVGELFRTGHLPTSRVVSIAGPAAARPRLIRTRVGAAIDQIVADEVGMRPARVISGDVLTGHTVQDPFTYLGRYHRQITLMPDASPRELLGWVLPGVNKFSTARVHLRHLLGRIRKALPMNTSLNGSARAMIPIGLYEDMIPMDVLATQLLRAILVMDTEMAQALGVLELDEEDLALCTFICHSKYEYGMALRNCLNKIEAEG